MKTRLYQGDCLEIMRSIPDESVDMILCDLPYGTTRNTWDKVIPFPELWAQYKRIVKDNAAIVLFAMMPFTAKLVLSNEKDFRYSLVLKKENPVGFLNANRMPLRNHEDIVVFYESLPVYNPQMRKGDPYIRNRRGAATPNYGKQKLETKTVSESGDRYPVSVLEGYGQERGFHPTQKSTKLLEYLIKTYTNPEAVVLDNCMESGSTGVACVNANRNFIGIELDKGYFDVAKKRIDDAKAQIRLAL